LPDAAIRLTPVDIGLPQIFKYKDALQQGQAFQILASRRRAQGARKIYNLFLCGG
jgi:hypothetical protein